MASLMVFNVRLPGIDRRHELRAEQPHAEDV